MQKEKKKCKNAIYETDVKKDIHIANKNKGLLIKQNVFLELFAIFFKKHDL